MSEYRRSRAQGATFFFTVVTERRRPILTRPEVRDALRNAIRRVRTELPFVVHGWVLLPDHLHSIWELPSGDSAFGKRWGLIKAGVSKTCRPLWSEEPASSSQTKRHESGIWQRRFWEHQIRDKEDFARHMDYIHWNPVKHGHVSYARDWPYSSFHRYVNAEKYLAGWGMAEGDPGAGEYGE